MSLGQFPKLVVHWTTGFGGCPTATAPLTNWVPTGWWVCISLLVAFFFKVLFPRLGMNHQEVAYELILTTSWPKEQQEGRGLRGFVGTKGSSQGRHWAHGSTTGDPWFKPCFLDHTQWWARKVKLNHGLSAFPAAHEEEMRGEHIQNAQPLIPSSSQR